MEEITFSVRLIKTQGSTLEVFIRKHWLAKKLLNNSAWIFLLSNVPILKKQWLDAGNLFIVEK